ILLSAGVMIASALTFLPAEVPAIANGAVYGVVQGALLSWLSGMVGANIAFAIGRWGGERFLGYFLGPVQSARVGRWIEKSGGISLLIARCIPLFPFFILNFGAGIVGMHWWTFNWATGLGLIPATLGFAILGKQMGHLTLAQGSLVIAVALGLIGTATYFARAHMVDAKDS
ncbi:MAG: VTT domain-containing protein, partial [Fimbriimonadaceae bacterium]|nr:VTT domain-containing protein [Alphaproteobacteria bacterium]